MYGGRPKMKANWGSNMIVFVNLVILIRYPRMVMKYRWGKWVTFVVENKFWGCEQSIQYWGDVVCVKPEIMIFYTFYYLIFVENKLLN